MRLTAIKLAGFKSFVDPTTISLPSNLLAVVGPNGCGKSNIIDAVRWVMGESSARQLRGESMSDVIFSGSSARKPVTTATVELIFDNSDGRAGGEFARYNEISVRRQVSRDGQSAYFLNGSRCRRKDITDLFLGTGLGPRSYAIIEQGMISQIVEARPEELRAFLEEAAGVSLYKERRRETENRIRHTRENLERLTDLREEVDRQLARLKRQAAAADRYQRLKRQERELRARLAALRWRDARARLESAGTVWRDSETALARALADLREAEKRLEALRERQHEAGEQASAVQAELFEITGEIARIEQDVAHQQSMLERSRKEHAEVQSQLDELRQHLVLDRTQVEKMTESIASLEPELARARAVEEQARVALEAAEHETGAAQQAAQQAQREHASVAQQVELARLRIQHAEERIEQAGKRLEQLAIDDQQAHDTLASEIGETRQALERLTAKIAEAARALETARERRESLRAAHAEDATKLDQLMTRRRELSGRLESLRVLNRPPVDDEELRQRLRAAGLEGAAVLLERLEVETGWQHAVETVLSRWLTARVVDGPISKELLGSGCDLVADAGGEAAPGTLAAQVRGAGALTAWLAGIHCAEDINEALARLKTLGPGDTVITRQGQWLGRGWVISGAQSGDQADGRIARQQEIRKLESELAGLAEACARLEHAREQRQLALRETENKLQRMQADLEQLKSRQAELQGLRSGQEHRLETLKRQRERLERERRELEARRKQDQDALSEARAGLTRLMDELERTAHREQEALAALKSHQEALQQRRQQWREAREGREALALKLEAARSGLASLKQSIARMDSQIGQLQSRFVELSEVIAHGDEPVRALIETRDRLLEKRLEIEKRLHQARSVVDELEAEWRRTDEARRKAAQAVEQVRQQQADHKVRLRELELEAEAHAREVTELDGDIEALVAAIDEDADPGEWTAELERLAERIRRLEPVNLAAISEYEQESERKTYLDQQHADLVEALETLEQAIARIDRTTRTRYKDTFERVNANLEQLFPRLFGGGHAHIEMVGDDWLTAGAAIMARPPGKRISHIHLLSGGEKALTAVAFVFSIFNLNPAPFCMLDEVDAPLDDANVGRFSELVREMSEKVQFVVVTHNKVTMEVAHQMIGVTMREPGISRLVSVDLDKAVELAAN